jgi:hypothetical protein
MHGSERWSELCNQHGLDRMTIELLLVNQLQDACLELVIGFTSYQVLML